jgi:murein DD-endopeptidase MepM/ murein hydrolase activator NlpD
MSAAPLSPHAFARRKPPHRIIIARGENVRSFRIRSWVVAAVGGFVLVFGTLYIAATGYLVFRDDILAASIARQTQMQHAYEDRIALLRSDIDRLTSRQLLNQEAVEAEVERLLGRQAALDARQDVIAGLSQALRRSGMDAEDDTSDEAPTAPAEVGGPLTTGGLMPVGDSDESPAVGGGLAGIAGMTSAPVVEMQAVEFSLDELARQQIAYVDAVAAAVSDRNARIASVLKGLGHRPPASPLAADTALGGPFVAIDEDADPETFRASVDLVTGEIERFATVRRFAGQLPLSRPIPDASVTSRFGRRIDPFLGKPAMHTGIDFRAAAGHPAQATAGGTVITAEYSGGYGNMVEIDHGNGITTRFGHMSRIDVTAGQVVSEGTVVGRAGSTGRSTGPHLHYEIRIDGAAIDPMRYISAGTEIAPLL